MLGATGYFAVDIGAVPFERWACSH